MKPDYHRIIAAPAGDRRDLFVVAARRVGTTEQNVEKDFWVCCSDHTSRDDPHHVSSRGVKRPAFVRPATAEIGC